MEINIKARQNDSDEIFIWVLTSEGHMMLENTIMIDSSNKNVTILSDQSPPEQEVLDFIAKDHIVACSLFREHNEILMNIINRACVKIQEKGWVWSEMRRKCEIDCKLENNVWFLSFKMTGLTGNVNMDEFPHDVLGYAISDILFQ